MERLQDHFRRVRRVWAVHGRKSRHVRASVGTQRGSFRSSAVPRNSRCPNRSWTSGGRLDWPSKTITDGFPCGIGMKGHFSRSTSEGLAPLDESKVKSQRRRSKRRQTIEGRQGEVQVVSVRWMTLLQVRTIALCGLFVHNGNRLEGSLYHDLKLRRRHGQRFPQVLSGFQTRISFRRVVSAIEQGGLVTASWIIPISRSWTSMVTCISPFVISVDGSRFLKTIIPSRKATRDHKRRQSP